jgi:hypothetical protein
MLAGSSLSQTPQGSGVCDRLLSDPGAVAGHRALHLETAPEQRLHIRAPVPGPTDLASFRLCALPDLR